MIDFNSSQYKVSFRLELRMRYTKANFRRLNINNNTEFLSQKSVSFMLSLSLRRTCQILPEIHIYLINKLILLLILYARIGFFVSISIKSHYCCLNSVSKEVVWVNIKEFTFWTHLVVWESCQRKKVVY